MDLLDRMLGHDQWMTAKVLELSSDLTDEQIDQDFDIGHRTVRATFAHMIYAYECWTKMMDDQPLERQREGESIAKLTERHARSYPAFAAVARRLTDEQKLDDIFIDYYEVRQSNGGTIVNVVLHNGQHRSEILHILQRLGVPNLPDGDPQEWEHMTHRI